ncbi:MAG: hypothetical protein D6702_04245 [Planctomycetota bacterium]|nr:MAG: hypothetical protein D6702_04245 [Planctomycetota bacterium]
MLLAIAGLVACGGGPDEPLADPRAVVWRPADGRVLVICEGGRRIRTFDPFLRPLADLRLPFAAAEAAVAGGAFLLRDRAGRVLDERGRPAPSPAGVVFTAALECPGPGSRRLVLDPERGELRLGPAPWEHPGEVEWGPGWAAVRIRSSRPIGPAVEWRLAGGGSRLAAVRSDPDDPLLRIAWLEPVAAGTRIELRHRPAFARFPAPEWSPWYRLEVPAVAPAGPRPVTVLATAEVVAGEGT